MSPAYRKTILSSDDDTKLRTLVHSSPSAAKLVTLIQAQQKKVRAKGGFFETAANALEVAVRSRGVTQAQSALLHRLVEHYGIEAVVSFVEHEGQVRHSIQDSLHLVMTPNEGAEKYRGQYDLALKSLDVFGINRKEAPTWPEIAARLTPEKLALIEKVEGAQLILVPPLSRQDLVKTMNNKVGTHGMKHEAYTNQLEDDQLWNNGKSESLTWEIAFVDGRQDVPYNEKLQAGKTVHEQVKALRALHKKDGVGTLVGARMYLSLMMQGLIAKTPTDKKYWTVLNADIVAKDEKALLGRGGWNFDQVSLHSVFPNFQFDSLRLRAAVRV